MFFVETLPNGETRIRFPNQLPRPKLPDFKTWDELRGWLEPLADKQLFWRGLPDFEYALKSKLQRVLEETGIPKAEWLAVEEAALQVFKERARDRARGVPEDDRLAWLGVMQHYGAPTRLTDWSIDPRVALFFACEPFGPDTRRSSAPLRTFFGGHAIQQRSVASRLSHSVWA